MNALVAVYGTLRAGYGNHTLLGDSPLLGAGITKDKFLMLAAGFPVCLDEGADTRVVVEVYDVGRSSNPEATLRRLDTLEGHPDWYRRRLVYVRLLDGEVQAWMYIMPGSREDFPRWEHIPSGDYTMYRRRK